jgi:hypothetical protein
MRTSKLDKSIGAIDIRTCMNSSPKKSCTQSPGTISQSSVIKKEWMETDSKENWKCPKLCFSSLQGRIQNSFFLLSLYGKFEDRMYKYVTWIDIIKLYCRANLCFILKASNVRYYTNSLIIYLLPEFLIFTFAISLQNSLFHTCL